MKKKQQNKFKTKQQKGNEITRRKQENHFVLSQKQGSRQLRHKTVQLHCLDCKPTTQEKPNTKSLLIKISYRITNITKKLELQGNNVFHSLKVKQETNNNITKTKEKHTKNKANIIKQKGRNIHHEFLKEQKKKQLPKMKATWVSKKGMLGKFVSKKQALTEENKKTEETPQKMFPNRGRWTKGKEK